MRALKNLIVCEQYGLHSSKWSLQIALRVYYLCCESSLKSAFCDINFSLFWTSSVPYPIENLGYFTSPNFTEAATSFNEFL